MPRTNYKAKTLSILQEICKKYPTELLSQHLDTVLSDYETLDSISDKEMFFAFEKYKATKEMDDSIPHFKGKTELERIIEEGMHLDTIFNEEDEDY